MKNGKFIALMLTGAAVMVLLSSLVIVIKSPSATDLVKTAAPAAQTSAVVSLETNTIADDKE
jgi:hypothetical protein